MLQLCGGISRSMVRPAMEFRVAGLYRLTTAGGVVLGVEVAGEAFAADAVFEGHSLVAAHRTADGDEVGSAAIGGENLWM